MYLMRLVVISVALGLCTAVLEAAKINVRAEPDPSFDFKAARTWAWDADAGDVYMARTPKDDPAALKERIDPLIRKYVEAEMRKKGLQPAAAGATPDLHLHYYVLITINQTGQTMGQFLPAVPYWGLPPFAPATQSLQMMNQGSLVLDLKTSSAVVWRGVAQAQIKPDMDFKKREAMLREGVRDLLRRYPPKQ